MFNVIPKDCPLPLINQLSVEYPQVADRIQLFWGTSDFISYMDNIMLLDQPREGFNPNMFSILFEISQTHKEVYSELYTSCSWSIGY